jgi:hypothetical protein
VRSKFEPIDPWGVLGEMVKTRDERDKIVGKTDLSKDPEEHGKDNRVEGLGKVKEKGVRVRELGSFASKGKDVVNGLVTPPKAKLRVVESIVFGKVGVEVVGGMCG